METILGVNAIAFWIVTTGILVNVSGALLGNYLILRRMSLLGDAVAHAVLPGLAIAFLVTQSRAPLPMLCGALLAGLLTVLLTELIRRYAEVPEDAALGVVFTSLFALGVVIISRSASAVDLDPGCVLYGVLETAAIDTVSLWGWEVPRVVLTMSVVTLAIVAFVVLFWKELKIVSFDPALAVSLGLNARVVHYLLMALIAAYTVAAFEAVGSILVVAMLVVPAATAYLLTDRLRWMAVLAALAGASAACFGRWCAWELETSVAGMMAVVAGGQCALAVLFAPRHGYLAKRIFRARVSLRIVREDLLAMLYRWREHVGEKPLPRREALAAVGGGALPRLILAQLLRRGWIELSSAGVRLAAAGLPHGATIVQGHRLCEAYLARHFDLPADHLHEPAHRMEHYLDAELVGRIAAAVDHPAVDPHGKPIVPVE